MTDEYDQDLGQLNGVGQKTEDKLKSNGYQDLMDVARADSTNMSDRTGIGNSRCEKMIGHARELISGGNEFQTGKQVEKEQDKIQKITTGSNAFDDMLYGGIPTKAITEAYGAFGRGKSQLAMQLAVNVQLPEDQGGLNKKALIIDTEDTFSVDRFKQMAEAQGLDPDDALNNIILAEAFDSGHQLKLGEKAHKVCSEHDIGVIIVDSLIAAFRSDYDGRGELAARQQALNRHLKDLKSLASKNNAAVYVTNQVVSDPGVQFGNPEKPAGGNIVAHYSQFIIYLKGKKNFLARLVDSPNLPQSECQFDITEEGIRDV